MAHAFNFIDRTGLKVNRITFLEFVDRTESGNARWKVRCDCGCEFIAISSNVLFGTTRSCECYRDEMNRVRAKDKKAKQLK